LSYPLALARHLGRDDLQIHAPSALDDFRLYAGRVLPGLVLDHATVLLPRQRDHFDRALGCVAEPSHP
jgi:hypothetical protein